MELHRIPADMYAEAKAAGLSRKQVERVWKGVKSWHYMNDAGQWVVQDEGKPDRFASPAEALAFGAELMDDPEMRDAIGTH